MRRELDGVLAFGTYGLPVLVFPSQDGTRDEWEQRGMVAAVGDLLDAGRVKLYCVESRDAGTWFDDWLPLEERARRHGEYEDWLLGHVVPVIHADCGGPVEIATAGVSIGARHAAGLVLRRADVFPLALCLSGVYDLGGVGWGERGDAFSAYDPAAYVAGLGGERLDRLRPRASLLLVVGRGRWEDSTGALEQTQRFAALLAAKGIRHELDVWGEDAPHDWPAWRAQIAKHLPRVA